MCSQFTSNPCICATCGKEFHIVPSRRQAGRGKYCSRACQYLPTPILRFWAKVDRRGPDECWEWRGSIYTKTGYGQFWTGEKATVAHRFAYELLIGPIPAGRNIFIHHHCCNRRCVNPRHIEAVIQRVHPDAAPAMHAAKTHCKRGHEYTPENTIRVPNGRACRTCKRLYDRKHRLRHGPAPTP